MSLNLKLLNYCTWYVTWPAHSPFQGVLTRASLWHCWCASDWGLVLPPDPDLGIEGPRSGWAEHNRDGPRPRAELHNAPYTSARQCRAIHMHRNTQIITGFNLALVMYSRGRVQRV